MAGIFKAYDIRGSYPDELNEEIALKIGAGFVNFLKAKNIVVGRDMRLSSPSLTEAFIKGALGGGVLVTDIGIVTTPMLYYSIIMGEFDGGAMVTASHLPAEFNGLKLCREGAIPVSGDTGLQVLEEWIKKGGKIIVRKTSNPETQKLDFLWRYIDKLSGFVNTQAPLRIVVDAGNGTVGQEVFALAERFPAWDLITMYMEPDGRFPHHVANPLIESTTVDLQDRVVREKADIGIAFDGDADRCGFIDEKGERIHEDLITALIAESFLANNPGAAIVYDLRSSRTVPETISRLGGKAVRCRVGHAFIKELMRKENAVFAGELSGHYYYRDMGFTDNAVFTMIWMLNFLSAKKTPLSELVKRLKKYHSTGEINLQVRDKEQIFTTLEKFYTDGAIDHLDGLTVQYKSWWFNLRASNTEAVVRLNMEADDIKTLEEKKKEVLGIIKDAEPSMRQL